MAQLNEENSVKPTSVNKPNDSVLIEAHQLLGAGRKLVEEESYESGIDQLSDALALMAESFGELDPRNGVFYLAYGKALLAQGDGMMQNLLNPSQKKPEVLLDEKEALEKDKSEEKDPLPQDDAVTKSKPAQGSSNPPQAKMKEDVDLNNASNSSLLQAKTKEDGALKKDNAQPSEEQTSAAGEGATSATENRELAWQLFETARVIFANDEKMQEQEKSKQLGEVHLLLGEVALGDGSFDKGYAEFTTSIKLFGKCLQLSDPNIGRAQQLAGLCAVHLQELEAAQFHYTAAAENHNMHLEELLIKAGVMQPKKPNEPESEDIEFVDRKYLEALKDEAGEEAEMYKKCFEIFGIVNDLIDRVEELMEEEEQKKKQMENVMKIIAEKMRSGEFPGCVPVKEDILGAVTSKTSDQKVTEQMGFDASQQPGGGEVQQLGTFGGGMRKVKRAAPLEVRRKNGDIVCKKVRTG